MGKLTVLTINWQSNGSGNINAMKKYGYLICNMNRTKACSRAQLAHFISFWRPFRRYYGGKCCFRLSFNVAFLLWWNMRWCDVADTTSIQKTSNFYFLSSRYK